MDTLCIVLRTGCPWHVLHETGLCSRSAAHRRGQEWTAAGVVRVLWESRLVASEALRGGVIEQGLRWMPLCPADAEGVNIPRPQLERLTQTLCSAACVDKVARSRRYSIRKGHLSPATPHDKGRWKSIQQP
jgi:hypothetical protein